MRDIIKKVSISEFRKLVAFNYININLNLVDSIMRMAIIQFCKESGVLRRSVEIQTQGDYEDYLIYSDDSDEIVFKVVSAKLYSDCECINLVNNNGRCIDCKINEYSISGNRVKLCNPDSMKLLMKFVAVPSQTSCEFDADLLNIWSGGISSYFNHKLMSGNDKRWRNISQSRIELSEYRRAVDEAMLYAKRGGVERVVTNDKINRDKKYHQKSRNFRRLYG